MVGILDILIIITMANNKPTLAQLATIIKALDQSSSMGPIFYRCSSFNTHIPPWFDFMPNFILIEPLPIAGFNLKKSIVKRPINIRGYNNLMGLVFCLTLICKEIFPSILLVMIEMHPSETHKLDCISTICSLLACENLPEILIIITISTMTHYYHHHTTPQSSLPYYIYLVGFQGSTFLFPNCVFFFVCLQSNMSRLLSSLLLLVSS